jgi:hypothetical protein
MAAHPIGDEEETFLFITEVTILVLSVGLADLRESEGCEFHHCPSSTSDRYERFFERGLLLQAAKQRPVADSKTMNLERLACRTVKGLLSGKS